MLSQRIAKLYLALYWAIPYKNLETEDTMLKQMNEVTSLYVQVVQIASK